MIVEVVFGSVLIVLGLCALLGLPTILLRLQRRDERSHAFEKDGIARQATPDAPNPNITFH